MHIMAAYGGTCSRPGRLLLVLAVLYLSIVGRSSCCTRNACRPLKRGPLSTGAGTRPVVAPRLPAAGLDLDVQRRGSNRLRPASACVASSRPQSATLVAMRAREISPLSPKIPIDQARQIAEKDGARAE